MVVDEPTDDRPHGEHTPFHHLLDEIGLEAVATSRRLAALNVAVFGLEAHGAHIASLLADAGVGTLALVDPYTFEHAHRVLTPVRDASAVGMSRQDALAAQLRRDGLAIELPAKADVVERETVIDAVERCDLAIGCWDRGMSAAEHWVNQAAIASGTPALFGELRATSCFAGPFVFPSRSACLMCYRMRASPPKQTSSRRWHTRSTWTASGARRWPSARSCRACRCHLASILALEALSYLIRLNQPRLVDRVLEFDALHVATHLHPVLVEPGCPACGTKKSPRPSRPGSAPPRGTADGAGRGGRRQAGEPPHGDRRPSFSSPPATRPSRTCRRSGGPSSRTALSPPSPTTAIATAPARASARGPRGCPASARRRSGTRAGAGRRTS